jgi:hypothetical protein
MIRVSRQKDRTENPLPKLMSGVSEMSLYAAQSL